MNIFRVVGSDTNTMALNVTVPDLVVTVPDVEENHNVYFYYSSEAIVPLLRKRYEMLLNEGRFRAYVKYYDAMPNHTPMAAVPLVEKSPHLDKTRIQHLFSSITQPSTDSITPFIMEQYVRHGFVVLEDDWMNMWVYVGYDDSSFKTWLAQESKV